MPPPQKKKKKRLDQNEFDWLKMFEESVEYFIKVTKAQGWESCQE